MRQEFPGQKPFQDALRTRLGDEQLAPIFVPMLMQLGHSPELLSACRSVCTAVCEEGGHRHIGTVDAALFNHIPCDLDHHANSLLGAGNSVRSAGSV